MQLDNAYRPVSALYNTPAIGEAIAGSLIHPMTAPQDRQQRPIPTTAAPVTALRFPSLCQAFVYLAFFLRSLVMAHSFVGGDLSQKTPYGLPAQEFTAAINTPASAVTFPIPGYDVSIPPADQFAKATIDTIPNWSLTVGVTGNVPLAKASDASLVDKNLYVAAAGLSITPPADVTEHNSTGWRLCATVFTAGLSPFAIGRVAKEAQTNRVKDGTCTGTFPNACIRRLQLTSVSDRADRDASCRDLDVPFECAAYFAGNRGTAFEINPIGLSKLPDRRSMFFSAALEPARKGNRSALAAAQRRVWPVLFAWTYFNQSGMVQDSAGWLSCATTGESARASRGKVRSVLDPEDPSVHKSRAALLVGILVASAMMIGS